MPDPLLRWQFDLTWALLDYYLPDLTDADLFWKPAPHCWTVRQGEDGRWWPDWVEPEPHPAPATSVGWLTWHLCWWWGTAVAHVHGRTAPPREEVDWPGDASRTVARLRELREDWLGGVDQLTPSDLDAVASFPWRDNPERTVGHMVAWVNAELMKNTAEIGDLVRLRAAITAGPD